MPVLELSTKKKNSIQRTEEYYNALHQYSAKWRRY